MNGTAHVLTSHFTGITAAAVKRMTGWKCPQCYISPFSETLCGDADAFAQFKNAMKNIKEVNGNLTEDSNAIEFFNSHLKHLLLEPAEFLKHSERIGAVEKGLSEIQKSRTSYVSNPTACLTPVKMSLLKCRKSEKN